LSNHGISDFVVNRCAEENDAVFEKTAVDIPRPLSTGISFNDVRDNIAHGV
jgi:hypothetical protein